LIIHSDFHSKKWTHILTKLRHLELDYYVVISAENFLRLLASTPHLQSFVAEKRVLQIATEHWNNVSICHHLSRKILSLKVCRRKVRSQFISEHEIRRIIQVFSSKCQHLSLYVQSPHDSVGIILQNMLQLHSLHVTVTGKTHPPIGMAWLQKQQSYFNSSNCIIVNHECDHHFWLENQQ
jgi:hypothetical protein